MSPAYALKGNTDPASSENTEGLPSDSAVAKIKSLFRNLPSNEQQEVLRDLASASPPISTPRAGVVLEAMARILAHRVQWTMPDLKRVMKESGVDAAPKDIYNAIGYLARRGYVKKVGYGRYLVEGAMMVTSEDFGGPPHDGPWTPAHRPSHRLRERQCQAERGSDSAYPSDDQSGRYERGYRPGHGRHPSDDKQDQARPLLASCAK